MPTMVLTTVHTPVEEEGTPVHHFYTSSSSTPAQALCDAEETRYSSDSPSFMDDSIPVSLESSKEDLSEESCVEQFISDTCGCKTGPGQSACSTLLTRETIVKCRQDNLELASNELDLVVLGQIRVHHSVSSQSTPCLSRHKTSGMRQVIILHTWSTSL